VDVADVVHLNTSEVVSMRDLVKGALRMRPDRIIIGEVRDGAALEMLKAWNTGHPGGVCTVHANSAESTLYRLEDLIQEVVVTVPRNLILQAVDLMVYIDRQKNGKRVIREIVALKDFRDGRYQLESLI
jgi:type IV secretion system protein VirB11